MHRHYIFYSAHKLKTVFNTFPNVNQSVSSGLLYALGTDYLFAHDSLLVFFHIYVYKYHMHILELTLDERKQFSPAEIFVSP